MTYRIRRYLMRRTEFLLGVSVTLVALFALLAIFTGVDISAEMPGRYAWGDAERSFYFMAFLPILGIAVIVHGMRRSKTSEWIWGLILLLWSFFSWWWIPISIGDESSYFKGDFTGAFFTASWPLIVFVFQGIALTINGAFEKRAASTQDTAVGMDRDTAGILLGYLGGVISLLYVIMALIYIIVTSNPIVWITYYSPGLGTCILVILGTAIAHKRHKRIGAVLLTVSSAIGFTVFGGWLWALMGPLSPFNISLVQFTSVSGWIVLSLVGGLLLLSANPKRIAGHR